MTEIKYTKVKDGYELLEQHTYFSPRYNRSITCPKGMLSDGATGFIDLGTDNIMARVWNWFRKHIHHLSNTACPEWFFVHDQICVTGKFDDGTLIDNWTASTVAGDILWADGWRLWSVPIWFATFLFGGGEARKNGMFHVKEK